MKNMLLAFIFGSAESVVPVFLTIVGIIAIAFVFALIMAKKEEKDILENGRAIFPETLFEDVEKMKKDGVLRLYSKRIDKNSFVITASEISEEYKDGKFVSYASAKSDALRAKSISLKEFLKNLPEVNYKSMIKRIGAQTRIDCKPVFVDDKEIKGIRLLFDFDSNNIFFYNSEGYIISWDRSLIPPQWQKDEVFMSLNKQLCDKYERLFVIDKTSLSYAGFKNEQQRAEFIKVVDEFVKYVKEKNNGKYEFINDYDVENL